MFPFVRSTSVYRCPADKSSVLNMPSLARTRSYSLDMWLNSAKTGDGYAFTADTYPWMQVRLSTIRTLSSVFGFIDENEQSIDTGQFVIEQPKWIEDDATVDDWWSLAADRHRRGCNLSFLDGHVEHWPWKAAKVFKSFGTLASPGGDLQDHRKLAEAIPHNAVRDWPGE
jgi:prepilin-type processing-associated H-X9-DG protein